MDLKVSIITPTYNSELTIAQTIESVLGQTHQNIEYIIIDGKSTDNTLSIIDKYAKNSQGKLRYISEPDSGIYNAMNKGICMASGTLIGIINSDDWYEVEAIESIVKEYLKHGTAVYYGFLRFIKNEKEIALTMTHHQFYRERMIQHPTCLVPKCIYDKYGVFNEDYKLSADYDFYVRLKLAEVPFVQIHSVLANFREGGASTSSQGAIETSRIKNKYGFISRKTYFSNFFKAKMSEFFKILLNKKS